MTENKRQSDMERKGHIGWSHLEPFNRFLKAITSLKKEHKREQTPMIMAIGQQQYDNEGHTSVIQARVQQLYDRLLSLHEALNGKVILEPYNFYNSGNYVHLPVRRQSQPNLDFFDVLINYR